MELRLDLALDWAIDLDLAAVSVDGLQAQIGALQDPALVLQL
jgi:hypothetical protein